jgi:hypothetical protein
VWLPAGANVIEPAHKDPTLRILDFNGNLHSAKASATGVQISYQSNSRAIAVLNPRPRKIEIDGEEYGEKPLDSGPNVVLMLPKGQHIVELDGAPSRPATDLR